jgi:hypothetical protein
MARNPFYPGVQIGDFAELHFDPAEYEQQIDSYGVDCEIRPSVRCPCARIEDHKPRGNCKSCKGLGLLFPDDLRQTHRVLLYTRAPTKQPQPAPMVVGSITCTFPLGYVPGEWDLLLPDPEEHVVHQTIFRASLQTSNREAWNRTTTHDQHPPVLRPAEDRLLYPDPTAIEIVLWADTEGKVHTASPNDYRLMGDRVEWVGSRGPSAGSAYTIRYRARAAYVLEPSEPSFRQEDLNGLPYRCQATRLDRAGWPDLRDVSQ